jgi:Zn-dependent protease with chaperone function
MDQEKLNNLIDRLEDYANRSPTAYRLRVGLLASMGYAYLFVVVLFLLSLIYIFLYYVRFNFITIKIVWIPLVLIGLVLRSLWVNIPKPDGTELTVDQAPRLFDDVQEVQRVINGPKVHHILLSDDFNAGIVQVPRFGMFGWLSNYMVVGLPLLKAMDVEEFRAVMTHEFGHLSGKHGRFSGWIYRLRQSWIEILTRVHEERSYASFIFEPFLKWYAPYFNAYSFVLARAQEYEADGYSVDVAGKEVTARMLVRLSTKDRVLSDEFWPEFYRQANKETHPPKDPFGRMLLAMEKPGDDHKLRKWAVQSLQIKTGHEDTHPALSARLLGLGYRKDELDSVAIRSALTRANGSGQNAASYYLNSLPDEFVARFDRLWTEQIASTWHEQHNQVQVARQRLEELETASKARQLTTDELWERATLISNTEDSATALPVVRQILSIEPNHPGANLALGGILLSQKDSDAISYLEKAMSLDESTTGEACGLLYDFYLEQDELDKADSYRKRAENFVERMQRFYQQAFNFSNNDNFAPHGLSDAEVAQLRSQLKSIHGLGRTYLVRKIVENALEPVYVIGAFATYTWRHGENEKHVAALLNELAANVAFPQSLVFVSMDENQFLIKKFVKIPGSVLLEGDDETVELRH